MLPYTSQMQTVHAVIVVLHTGLILHQEELEAPLILSHIFYLSSDWPVATLGSTSFLKSGAVQLNNIPRLP